MIFNEEFKKVWNNQLNEGCKETPQTSSQNKPKVSEKAPKGKDKPVKQTEGAKKPVTEGVGSATTDYTFTDEEASFLIWQCENYIDQVYGGEEANIARRCAKELSKPSLSESVELTEMQRYAKKPVKESYDEGAIEAAGIIDKLLAQVGNYPTMDDLYYLSDMAGSVYDEESGFDMGSVLEEICANKPYNNSGAFSTSTLKRIFSQFARQWNKVRPQVLGESQDL